MSILTVGKLYDIKLMSTMKEIILIENIYNNV